MKHIEDNFQTTDGLKLYYQAWIPPKPKAVIQIAHGIWEHSSRYMNFANFIAPKGYAVYINDHRGHGKSEGKQYHAKNFEQIASDLYKMTEKIIKNHHGLPLILLGHSMGAFVSLFYAVEHTKKIDALVLWGSGTTGAGPSKILIFLAQIFAKIIPMKYFYTNIDPHVLTSDEESMHEYTTDPLIEAGKATARLGAEQFHFYNRVQGKLSQIQVPVLLQKGTDDKMVLNCQQLYEDLGTEDKTLKWYKNYKHELHSETKEKRENVFGDLVKWIERKIG